MNRAQLKQTLHSLALPGETPSSGQALRVPGLSQRWQWGIGLAMALVVAPMAFAILNAGLALVAGLLLGLLGIHGTPMVVQRLQNWSLREQRAEAQTHARDEIERAYIREVDGMQKDRQASQDKQIAFSALSEQHRRQAQNEPARAAELMDRAALFDKAVQREVQRQAELDGRRQQASARHERELAKLDTTEAVEAAGAARRQQELSAKEQWRLQTARRSLDNRFDRALAGLQLDVSGDERRPAGPDTYLALPSAKGDAP